MILQFAGKLACMDLVAAFPDARVFFASRLDRRLSGTLFLGEALKWIVRKCSFRIQYQPFPHQPIEYFVR